MCFGQTMSLSYGLIFVITTIPFFARCSNILIFPGLGEATHSLVSRVMGEKLVDRGHNVTMVTSSVFINSSWHASPSNRIPFVVYDSLYEREFILQSIEEFINASVRGEMSSDVYLRQLNKSVEFFSNEMESVLGNYDVMSQLLSTRFDVAILDPFAMFPLMVLERLGLPFVAFSAGTMSPSLARLFGLPSNPSYVPEGMTGLSDRMSFRERIQNFLTAATFVLFKQFFVNGFDEKRLIWGVSPELSTADAVMLDSRAFLTNGDLQLDYPRPYLPHTAMLGNSVQKAASLMSHGTILTFVESGVDSGVVLVSLGSFMTSMDREKIDIFADALSRLPYKVLWRTLPTMAPPSVANNTLVVPWVPQIDVLAHPNVIAFVSNGGGLGLYEAIYHGVPVVAVPFFTDHPDNAMRLVTRGLGLSLAIQTMTSDELYDAIMRVASDDSFRTATSRHSQIMQDWPTSGGEYGAFTVEQVIRHGRRLIRAKGQDMSGVTYYLVDVVTFIVCFVIVAWNIFRRMIRGVLSGCE